jgi:NADH-ubiquinone oxidoreductase B12 subunit family
MTLHPPEFPQFPHKMWRATPEWLETRLPSSTADPWAKRDAWRYSAFFSSKNRIARLAPGLGLGTLLFGVYVCADQYYMRYGAGAKETQKWDEWMHAREKRLGHDSHGH